MSTIRGEPQLVVERVERAVVTPPGEPPVDGLPRREVLRELTPRTTGANDVEHRVDQFALRVDPDAAAGDLVAEQRVDQRPLGVGQIRWVPRGG